MPRVQCQCGTEYDLTPEYYGLSSPCSNCNHLMRFIVAQSPADEGDLRPAVDFTASLIIQAGPDRIGEQIFLAGDAPIAVGKLPEQPISLLAPLVSRHHCTLVPSDAGHWRIEDHSSRNGIFVNRERLQSRELCHGDLLGVGDFALRYLCAGEPAAAPIAAADLGAATADLHHFTPEPLPTEPQLQPDPPDQPLQATPIPSAPAAQPRPPASRRSPGPLPVCPSCQQTLGPLDKICVTCGIDIKTGRPLRISHEVDENFLYANTESAIRFISWILPINLMPIASDAYGKFKPYAMWTLSAITAVVTIAVWIINANSGQGEFGPAKNLMLWAGDQPNHMLSLLATLNDSTPGEFHYYQFLTNAFLHQGILHIAGNLIFLLIFGNRVNALLGQWKATAAYLLLAVLSSIAFYLSEIGKPLTPELGASGAIMGMAGMYFVLMPTSRVYMVFWLRLGIFTGFRRFTKIFTMSGVWMLALWIGLNDLLPVLLGSRGGVAHWAHIGGFTSGVTLALLLLLTRQVDANGGDILSVTLGPAAWKFLGTPAERAAARASI